MAKDDETGIGLAPVGRETVQDRVYTELRRALITGLFAPGQVLTIRQLADALMTSTMPVREALGRLITEQALEVLPSRQIRVPEATPERLDDILRARILIEGEAVTLAAARMSPGLIDALRGHLREWEVLRLTTSPETMDREAQMNQTFHFAIYRACGSDALEKGDAAAARAALVADISRPFAYLREKLAKTGEMA